MSGYSDFLRDRSEEILARTEMSPEELAEHEERARRNKIDRIMAAAPPGPLPDTSEKRAGEAPGGEFASRKWVRSQLKDVVRGVGAGLAEYVGKKLAPLLAEIEQAKRSGEAVGRVADRVSTELAALRREFDLERKLEAQRNKRRVESLEIALLAAGRNPAEDAEAEAELPKFSEWNGGGHAQ